MGQNDPNSLPIQKKILSAGKSVAEFNEGAKIHFHFQSKLAKNDQILDDSRKWEKEDPMELVVGKKFKLEVWESCLKMMSIGEVADLIVRHRIHRIPVIDEGRLVGLITSLDLVRLLCLD